MTYGHSRIQPAGLCTAFIPGDRFDSGALGYDHGYGHVNGHEREGFPHHGDDVHANDRVDDHRSCVRCRALPR